MWLGLSLNTSLQVISMKLQITNTKVQKVSTIPALSLSEQRKGIKSLWKKSLVNSDKKEETGKMRGIFYCENCGKDGLDDLEVVSDNLGGIFCSVKCRKDFAKVMKENRKEEKKYGIKFILPG